MTGFESDTLRQKMSEREREGGRESRRVEVREGDKQAYYQIVKGKDG